MARVMRIVSDLSGSENAQEYTFFDSEGNEMVIALTRSEYYNFNRTRESVKKRMDKWTALAKPKKSVTTVPPVVGRNGLSDSFFVRNWAKTEGYAVSDRGVIPMHIWNDWRKAGAPRSADK